MRLRTATTDDLPALNAIALAGKASWGYPDEWLNAWLPELTLSPEHLRESFTVLAEADAGPCGFFTLCPAAPEWVLDHLWVHPGAQGRGLGRALLQRAMRLARDADRAGVAIDADPFAEPFYLHLGARRVGVTPAPMPGAPARVRPQLWLPTLPIT